MKDIIIALLALPVSLYLALFLHELAHAAMAELLGADIRSVQVLVDSRRPSVQLGKLRLGLSLTARSWCEVEHPKVWSTHEPWRHAVVAIAGGAANVLFGLLALLAYTDMMRETAQGLVGQVTVVFAITQAYVAGTSLLWATGATSDFGVARQALLQQRALSRQ